MKMAPITIGLGVFLIVLGLGGYAWIQFSSLSALSIPAFGLIMLLLGLAALKDGWRKHAMHAAAALGMIGFLGALIRVVMRLTSARGMGMGPDYGHGVETVTCLSITALACAIFVGLCVKSFIDARRRRAQQA